MNEKHTPLQGAQLDAFRETVRQKSGHAARTDKDLAGVQLAALYVAGVAEGMGAVTPESLESALHERHVFAETLFSESELEGGTAEQKITAIAELLETAYTASSKTPTAGARHSDASQLTMRYSDRKRENPPLDAGQHEYFVHEAITKQARFNFKPYGHDIAYLAGVMDGKGGITARTIEEAVYSHPLFHPEPKYNELTDALVAAAEAARDLSPKREVAEKVEKEMPSSTVESEKQTTSAIPLEIAKSMIFRKLKGLDNDVRHVVRSVLDIAMSEVGTRRTGLTQDSVEEWLDSRKNITRAEKDIAKKIVQDVFQQYKGRGEGKDSGLSR